MRVPPHLIVLYNRTARRYRKLVSKIRRRNHSAYKQKTFEEEIHRLVRKLKALRTQLRVAVAAGAVVMVMQANSAQAQEVPQPASTLGPFVKKNRIENPLREPIFCIGPIAVADFDGDSDLDVIAGDGDYYDDGSQLRYFENQSTEGHPLYLEKTGEENPFFEIQAETYQVVPVMADIDKDGDLDLFLGQSGSYRYGYYYNGTGRGIEYYRNDDGVFSKQQGAWDPSTKEGNPFDGLAFGYDVSPVIVDFDKDGDDDLVVASDVQTGSYPYYYQKYLHYFENDGSGGFTEVTITLEDDPSYNGYYGGFLHPALADVDEDGDLDMVLGNYNTGSLLYYRQDGTLNFVLDDLEWDPVTKEGNPFLSLEVGRYASPTFIDFDKDGKLDLFVADRQGYYNAKYSDRIINYYRNPGDFNLDQKYEFDNPFDGVNVKQDASPVLMDIDGDGDLDALIGNKYRGSYYDYTTMQTIYVDSYVTQYLQEDDRFVKTEKTSSPFNGIEIYGNFYPQFTDIDNDNDEDLISSDYYGYIKLFRNEDGDFDEDDQTNPFADIYTPYYTYTKLVDLDGDDDLDVFMSPRYNPTAYYENNGQVYSLFQGSKHPLDTVNYLQNGNPALVFADLDHDGDQDLVYDGYHPVDGSDQIMLIENTGARDNPVLKTIHLGLFPNIDYAQLFFVDFDDDGDLDAFAGNDEGSVSYLRNENEVVNTTVTSTATYYDSDGGPVYVEPALTLSDPDNDIIVQAKVIIEDYQAGEMLGWTPSDQIAGNFDETMGELTFRGKGSIADYQAILRTVTFFTEDETGGRQRPAKKTLINKTISIAVYDQDFTEPMLAAKAVEIFVNDPPVVNAISVNVVTGGTKVVDLKPYLSDPQGATDLDLTSLSITPASSTAGISIDNNGMLTLDYTSLTFIGTETVTVEVCDSRGLCAQNVLTVTVTNTPPVVTPEPVSTPAGTVKSINLMSITTDVDDNLDPNAFSVVSPPISGAIATIQVISTTQVNLNLDYQGITFSGTDQMRIRACDKAGACSENNVAIQVDVESPIVVYNAVAPNSSGDNRFMRITGLPAAHKVSIFNRWGDRVYEAENYVNTPEGNAFSGSSDSGKALPSGTYFYTIEIPGQKTITGYVVLKQ